MAQNLGYLPDLERALAEITAVPDGLPFDEGSHRVGPSVRRKLLFVVPRFYVVFKLLLVKLRGVYLREV